MEKKSIPLALVLAIVFGPLGLLYASIGAGVFLIAALLLLFLVAPIALPAVTPAAWVLSIIIALVATAGHNRRVSGQEESKKAAQSQAQDEEWSTLLEYDADARAAAEKLAPHGQAALNELRRVFAVVKDPAKLPAAADTILRNTEAKKDRLGELGQYLLPEEQARQRLAERGIDNPNAPGERGNRPLHRAAEAGDLELIGLLLSAGADAFETNMAGNTPAVLARNAGHAQAAELIAIHREQAAA